MTLYIKNIEIKNFRSIRKLSLKPNKLAVLVGQNDAGKSNILRSLNLFFNNKTTQQDTLEFNTDNNIFNTPNRRNKRAVEISIKLEIVLPDTYIEKNGHSVIWEKRWRRGGEPKENMIGIREVPFGTRGGVRQEKVRITPMSNVPSLLQNIEFVYVPAIKDVDYFSNLRAKIYSVIASEANRNFRNSSGNFENAIYSQLKELTDNINESLGFDSRLSLPSDLSHIFERLDFRSKDLNISLESRGDGIKARHIPLILKFMADKKHGYKDSRYPYNVIWGYEEPENNLEIGNCIKLADQFCSFLQDDISQILITTHSPVIYGLDRKDNDGSDLVSCHQIYQDADGGTREKSAATNLDDSMGATAWLTPKIQTAIDELKRNQQLHDEAKGLGKPTKPTIYVEGEADKIIFDKAVKVFFPNLCGRIHIVSKGRNAGVNYVKDMIKSWRFLANQYKDIPRAVGVLDVDKRGNAGTTENSEILNGTKFIENTSMNELNSNVESAKFFSIPMPPYFVPIYQAGFIISIDLECLYDKDAWEWAKVNKFTDTIDPYDMACDALKRQAHDEGVRIEQKLHDDWRVFVENRIRNDKKVSMARHFAGKEKKEFEERISCLKELLSNIVEYLNL